MAELSRDPDAPTAGLRFRRFARSPPRPAPPRAHSRRRGGRTHAMAVSRRASAGTENREHDRLIYRFNIAVTICRHVATGGVPRRQRDSCPGAAGKEAKNSFNDIFYHQRTEE